MIAKYINQTLKKQSKNNEVYTDFHLAAVVAKAVLMNRNLLGTKISSQRLFSDKTGIPEALLKSVWKILKFQYKIIETTTRKGTYILSDLTENHIKLINNLMEKAIHPTQRVLMDKLNIPKAGRSYQLRINGIWKKYDLLTSLEQNRRVIEELRTNLATLIGNKVNHTYNANEIFYFDDYEVLLISCIETFSRPKTGVVFLTPVAKIVNNAVQAANRKGILIQKPSHKAMMDELEQLCKGDRKIGIVYIGVNISSMLFSTDEVQGCKRLHELQKIYQFKILLDDRYAGIFKFAALKEIVAGGDKNSVLSIHRVCAQEWFMKVNAVAGCSSDIQKIEKRFKDKMVLVEPSLGHVLSILLQECLAENLDINFHQPMAQIVDAAKKSMLQSQLFVNEHILNQEGYIFRLQLAEGDFTKNIYNKLKTAGIHIVEEAVFSSGKHLTNVITISLADYNIVRKIETDLDKLYAVLKKNIKK
jgi:DNA-binding transcriptional MocR family regulator